MTTAHYTAQPLPTGRWALTAPIAGTPHRSVVCDCPDEATARALADDHNAERELIARLQGHLPPARGKACARLSVGDALL